MAEIEKDKEQWGKTSAIGLFKCQNQGSIFFPFPGKTRLLFAIFGLFLPGNRVGSQIKELESKFAKVLQICKNILVPTFSSFAAID